MFPSICPEAASPPSLEPAEVGRQPCTKIFILCTKPSLISDRLNVLAKRLDESTLEISGSVNYNGSQYQDTGCAYVTQQDSLIPSLTVRQTLQFGAELRLRDVPSAEERHAIVEQTILELSLKECAATPIGSSFAKGCSGGEKRRTSIGLQVSRALGLVEPS